MDLANLDFVWALGVSRVKGQTPEEKDRFPSGADGAATVCTSRGCLCLKRIGTCDNVK